MAVFSLFAYGSEQHGKSAKEAATKTFTTAFAAACESKKFVIDGPGKVGLEVEENTQKGVAEIISWLETQSEDEAHVINMSGFSRGSITCMRIANRLKEVENILIKTAEGHQKSEKRKRLLNQLNNIQLNMYLMDPVTGPFERRPKHARVIPDNVKNCVMIYQKDERRHDMIPQDIERIIVQSPEETQVFMLPLYGNHSDTTRIKSGAMASGPKLNWYLLHAFFTQHGTKFKKDKIPQIIYSEKYVDINNRPDKNKEDEDLPANPGAAGLLNLFSEHHKHREAHLKSGMAINFFDSSPIARYERSLNKDARFYVKDPDFFVNQLERELFKIAYPRTFNYLFEHNIYDSRIYDSRKDFESSQEWVKAELVTLEQGNKHLFKRLKSRGVSIKNREIKVGGARGCKYLEPCATVRQVIPRLIPASFYKDSPKDEHSFEQLNKLPSLEMEIYRRTFEYEREAFRGRSLKADWANQIRLDVNKIINLGSEDRAATHAEVLEKLQEHYKKLILTNSNSRLNGVLEKILAKNYRNYLITKGSLSNEILVNFIDHHFKLVKSTLHLVSLIVGYEEGYHLDSLGRWLENWGKRVEECLGPVGYNPLKAVVLILANILEGIGFFVKNGFGLKPISEMWLEFVEELRVGVLVTINETKVELKYQEMKGKLQTIKPRESDLPSDDDALSQSGAISK